MRHPKQHATRRLLLKSEIGLESKDRLAQPVKGYRQESTSDNTLVSHPNYSTLIVRLNSDSHPNPIDLIIDSYGCVVTEFIRSEYSETLGSFYVRSRV